MSLNESFQSLLDVLRVPTGAVAAASIDVPGRQGASLAKGCRTKFFATSLDLKRQSHQLVLSSQDYGLEISASAEHGSSE
jgi:hypothetical protein